MPATLDNNGLTIPTISEIRDEILNGTVLFPGYLTIFPGANVQPNSPDANLINIFAQVAVDEYEFLQMIYDAFDPDQARGPTLDARCAINGIQREAGTYTQQGVTVTAIGACNLQGLDLYPSNPFTVSDGQGNQYQLLTTYAFSGAGSAALLFQAATIGAIQSTVGAINSIVTVVAGVASVTNATGPAILGVPEETDAALRIRRSNSVANGSTGYADGLLGVLLAVPGVTGAKVYENDGPAIDSDGIPGHSIWVIVAGGGVGFDAAVAAAIYSKKDAGCGQTNGGTGALGQAFLTPTTVASAKITNGGSGYATAPAVLLTTQAGDTGLGATANAFLTNGVVTLIGITNPGSGYKLPPIISFSGGGGTGAAATAVMTATTVGSVGIVNAGNYYYNPPTVALESADGNGAGATATAAANPAGQITGFTMGSPGAGYTAPPKVVLNPNTVTTSIAQLAGPPIVIAFDQPIAQSIYFKAQVDPITGFEVDLVWLAAQLAATTYTIGQSADASSLIALIKKLAPNCYVSNAFVSVDGATWVALINTPGVNYQFNLPVGNVALIS
jgi:uncharacterized phage protein gp47/JayE